MLAPALITTCTAMAQALDQNKKVALLGGLRWLSSVDDSSLGRLADCAVEENWETGQVIFRQGERGEECFLLLDGAVQVLRSGLDGRNISLATLGPGSLFGELALFDGETRSATIEAVEPSRGLRLSGEVVISVLESHPRAAIELVIELSRRLRAANARLFDHALSSDSGRVAAALLSQVQARQEGGEPRRDVEIIAAPSDVARLAGAADDEASRVLHWLENEGTITIKRGRIIVHSPEEVAKYLA